MFYQNRFTERARQALTLAQEAAASFGHSYIGSEHLLLGLLREGGGPAAKALAAAGVTDEALVHQIEELSGRGTPDSTAPQGMTPRTKRIVELSVQSANEMGTGYVGTEHLLLGILREGQNVALTALANLKITPQILVEKLNEALGGVQDSVSGEPGTAANGGADSKDALSQFGRDLTAAAKEKPDLSVVVAVGPGGMVDGKEVEMILKPGDKVITSKYMGTEVKIDGEQLTIVKQSDVVAIVED